MSQRPATLLVSGWRSIAHSYAVVAQFECLEMLRRPGRVRLYFEDRPYYRSSWQAAAGIFDAAAERALLAMPGPPADVVPDAELRYVFPCDLLRPSRAARTVVFGTSEYLTVPPHFIAEGASVAEAQRRHGYTILTCSNWSRQGFLRAGVRPEGVAVLPHGFDPGLFQPASEAERARIRAESSVQPDDFVFLNVGAMSPNKGLRYLLRAFAEVVRRRPQAHLVLKGMDSLYTSRGYVDEQLKGLDAETARLATSRMSYLGDGLSFAQMALVYQSADCYVSSYVAEGFNMPVLEAAACGLPVICTAGGPTDDIVTDRFALRIKSKLQPVIDPNDPGAMGLKPNREHLVELMLKAIDDASFRQQARAEGPAHVGAHFTWEKVVDALLPIAFGTRG